MTTLKNKIKTKSFSRQRSLAAWFWLPMIAAVFDAVAIIAATLLAYFLRFYWPLGEYLPPRWHIQLGNYVLFGAVLGVVYLMVSWSYKGYSSRIRVPLEQEVGRILRGSLLAMGMVLAGIFFYREFSYSRLAFMGTLFLMIPALIVARTLFQRVQIWLFHRGVGVQRVALWGSGEVAEKLWHDFLRGKSQGFDFVGTIGPSPIPGMPSLGEIPMLRSLIFEHELDLLVMAPPAGEENQMSEIVKATEGLPVELLYVPSAIDISPSRIRVTEVGGKPLLRLKTLPMAGWRYVAKRIIDFAFSAVFLLVFSPLFGLLALAVYLDTGKPIFYKQKRVGMDGREFDVVKFRTMKVDAEAKSGPVWAKKGDPRVTRSGGFLRRWSLDELPQIWSVFVGHMSLVGPRPERPHFVEEFSQHIPQYLDRHRVKSGLTGWAQVNGLRGSDSTIEERTAYDLYYIENWSLWLDFRILLRTVATVIGGRGAM
jgi:exopolysaccharide biosynthesis polyprenyl glycosylphosphotransferase